MKILVTGSSGFIGRAVVDELTARGHEPILFDRDTPLGREISADVRILGSLVRAVDQADAIIHLAGMLGTEETIGAEKQAVEVNILGTLNVLRAAGDRPVVLIGTGHKGQPNPYAITKGAAEDLALARAQWTGASISVVRAYHVYGPGQKPPPPHGPATVRKIGPSFICRALTGMPVQVWGSGQQVIDMVYVGEVARVLVDTALADPATTRGKVLEAGTGRGMTVERVLRAILTATNSLSAIQHLPMRDGEPEDAVVVAKNPLCAEHPFPYMLGPTIDWYRQYLAQHPNLLAAEVPA